MEEIWTRELRGDLVAGGRNGKHGSYRDERESLFMMENDTKKIRAIRRTAGSTVLGRNVFAVFAVFAVLGRNVK